MVKKYLPAGRQVFLATILSITFVLLLLFLNNRNSLNFVENTPTLTAEVPTKAVEIPWQTYRNEKYGFEFQYEDNGRPMPVVEETKFTYQETIKQYNSPNFPRPTECKLNSEFESCNVYDDLISEKKYQFRDLNINSFTVSGDESPITFLYFSYNNKNYLIDLGLFVDDKYILDTLSTLKFLPDTTSFKTYKNTLYNFEFNFPNDLTVKSDTFVSNDYKTQVYSNEFAEYETPISGIEVSLTVDPDGCSKINPNSIKNDEMFSNVIKSQTNNVPYTSYHREWEGFTSDAVIFTANNLCPTINFSFGKNYQDKWQPIRDQIISTFKFSK